MKTPKKPKAIMCRTCSKPSEPYLLPEFKTGAGTLVPARWLTSEVCQECEAKEEAKAKEEENARQQAERLRQSGLADAYFTRVAFSQYRSDTPARERVARQIRPLYQDLSKGRGMGNLVMLGNAGVGKTFIAGAFAKECLRRSMKVMFCPVPELLLRLRAASLSGKQLVDLDKLMTMDVLVLDDIGAEKATEFVAENIYLIVDRWYRMDKRGLIVTSNMTLQRIGEVYGDRLASRLVGMCQQERGVIVDFDGCPDGRVEDLRLGDGK